MDDLKYWAAAAVIAVLLGLIPRIGSAAQAVVSCLPDGTAITSKTRLRMTVMSLDRATRTGRAIDGSKTDLLRATAAADAFARQQAAPSEVLNMLYQCDEYLLHDYAVGYFIVSSALIREITRRKAAK